MDMAFVKLPVPYAPEMLDPSSLLEIAPMIGRCAPVFESGLTCVST